MMGGMFFVSLLFVLLLLGFAYIIYVYANKESGWLKTTGQVIAIILAVIALLVLLYGGIYGGMMGRGGMGMMGPCWGGKGMMGGMMGGKMGGMMHDGKDRNEFMERMMEKEGMMEWMEEYMEKHGN
jgi:hypothetical protein